MVDIIQRSIVQWRQYDVLTNLVNNLISEIEGNVWDLKLEGAQAKLTPSGHPIS
jgi:hypothetical protein